MNHYAGTPAPRPSPEAIYERLSDYFPTHDLDNAGVGKLANSADFTSAAAPVSGVRREYSSIPDTRLSTNASE